MKEEKNLQTVGIHLYSQRVWGILKKPHQCLSRGGWAPNHTLDLAYLIIVLPSPYPCLIIRAHLLHAYGEPFVFLQPSKPCLIPLPSMIYTAGIFSIYCNSLAPLPYQMCPMKSQIQIHDLPVHFVPTEGNSTNCIWSELA